jgi:lambda repressor-like predicted transcriptional regulator
VVHVLAETTTRIKATTASRLLAIKPAVHPGHRVTGPGPARRLQALAVLGWGPPALSERSGVAANTLAEVRSAVRCPTAQTAAVIRVLFDELWDQRPPVDTYARQQSVRTTLATARRHQWVPALAWDDIDTDAFPAQVVDERVTTTEEASFLARAGVGLTETARRLGVQPESVMEAMRRADRPDLAALLRHNDTRSAA